ncbi:hypothetical protein AHF37_06350 [Paragonimus kellicotti]|nr:hypothetical protein AHF37_06350 [Paragonimus kellicotti]
MEFVQVQSELNRFTDHIETIAVDVLNMVFMKDNTPEKMLCRDMLRLPLCSFGDVSLIDLCARAKCRQLLSLPYFQRLLDERWDGILTHVPNWIRWPIKLFPLIGVVYLDYKTRQQQTRVIQFQSRSSLNTSPLSTLHYFTDSHLSEPMQFSLGDRTTVLTQKPSTCCPCFSSKSTKTKHTHFSSQNTRQKTVNGNSCSLKVQSTTSVYDRVVGVSNWRQYPRCYFVLSVYRSPSTKFFFHSLFHLAFLFFFSAICLFGVLSQVTIAELIVVAYVTGYALEELRQLSFEGMRDGWREYFKDVWNWIDMCAIGFTIAGFCIKLTAPSYPIRSFQEAYDSTLSITRNFYMISLTLFYVRTLYITSISKTIGPRLKMMSDMLRKDLVPLLVVFFICIFSFGVWFQGLIYPNSFYEKPHANRTYMKMRASNSLEKHQLPWMQTFKELFKRAFYNMFELSMILDEMSCEENVYCGYPLGFDIVIYFVFVLYTGIVNIILINLLIALFSNTVSRIEQESTAHWMASRYKMVKEYTEQTVLPPPLNIFCILYELVHCIIYHCRRYCHHRHSRVNRSGFHLIQRKLEKQSDYGELCSDISEPDEVTSHGVENSKGGGRYRARNTRQLLTMIGSMSDSEGSKDYEVDVVMKFILVQSFALQDRRPMLGYRENETKTGIRSGSDSLAEKTSMCSDNRSHELQEFVQNLSKRLENLENTFDKVISELERFTERIESIAVDVLNLVSLKDNTPEKMICRDMLSVPLRSFGHFSLLDLFAKAKCNELLSLPCCQRLLDERWHGVLTHFPSWMRWCSRLCPLTGLMYLECKVREERAKAASIHNAKTQLPLIRVHSNPKGQDETTTRKLSTTTNTFGSKPPARSLFVSSTNNSHMSMKRKTLDDLSLQTFPAMQTKESVKSIYDRVIGLDKWHTSPRLYFITGVYQSPSMKFCLHSLFHLLFLIFFSVVCVYSLHSYFTKAELISLIYVAGYAVEEIRQIAVEALRNELHDYLKDGWNWIDLLAISLTAVGFCIRLGAQTNFQSSYQEAHDPLLYSTRNLYMLGLNLFYMRTLYITSISQIIGPRLKMMADMLRKDLVPLLIVFAIFICSYGVWFQGLIYPNSFYQTVEERNSVELAATSGHRLGLSDAFKELFKRAFYSIFEVSIVLEEEICDDKSPYCGNPNGMNTVLYFVLVLYTGIVNIILINLLIALFSNTVSRIDQKATALWLAGRYKMVKEYSERTVLPPPFNILCVIYEIGCCIFYQARRYFRHSCRSRRSKDKKHMPPDLASRMNQLEGGSEWSSDTEDQINHGTGIRESKAVRTRLRNARHLQEVMGSPHGVPYSEKWELDAVLKFILLQSFALQDRRQTLGSGLSGKGLFGLQSPPQMTEHTAAAQTHEAPLLVTRVDERIDQLESKLDKLLSKLNKWPTEQKIVRTEQFSPRRLPIPLRMPKVTLDRADSDASIRSVHIPTSKEILEALSRHNSLSSQLNSNDGGSQHKLRTLDESPVRRLVIKKTQP